MKKKEEKEKSKKYRSSGRKSQASQKKFRILHGKKGSVLQFAALSSCILSARKKKYK
jgi:hypothetical protein